MDTPLVEIEEDGGTETEEDVEINEGVVRNVKKPAAPSKLNNNNIGHGQECKAESEKQQYWFRLRRHTNNSPRFIVKNNKNLYIFTLTKCLHFVQGRS